MNHYKRFADYYIPLLSIVVLLITWIILSIAGLLNQSVIPTVNEFIGAFKTLVQRGYFLNDLRTSLGILFPGLLIGIFIGFIFGIITGRVIFLYLTFGTYFNIWRALPAVALVPIYIQVFGINDFSKILIIALGVFFPVWINVHEGSSQLSSKYLNLAHSLNFNKKDFFIKIVVPNAIPFAIAGIRNSIAIAYIMLFVSEWIGAINGIGYRMNFAHIINRMDYLFIGLFQLGLLAFITDAIFVRLVALRFPWIGYTNK